jgi:predicted TIM-barrel fold metal-dependent hydrolase
MTAGAPATPPHGSHSISPYDDGLLPRADAPGRADLRDLPLLEYRPVSQLRQCASTHSVSAFPAVDAHAHLGRWLTRGRWAVDDVARFVTMMDQTNVTMAVNLDGMWGDELAANLSRYDEAFPGRFATFCQIDWSALRRPGGERDLAVSLRESVDAGARGVKVWKSLGLSVRDHRGNLVRPDDERLTELWDTAADLRIPVFMHTGDPPAFFEPLDGRNERLEELLENPGWAYYGAAYPSFDELLASFLTVVGRHPRTTFVGVHVAGFAEDLAWVGRALDDHDNLFIDIASRMAELGRQPRATRALVAAHPTRVLFGSDGIPPTAGLYEIYFRFLESADEHFPYSEIDPPPTGRWHIAGLALPHDVLDQVYRRNFEHIALLGARGDTAES